MASAELQIPEHIQETQNITREELEMILQHTEMKNPCIFRSNHVSNLYPVGGTLPMDKEKMLAALQSYIPMLDDTVPLLNDNGNF